MSNFFEDVGDFGKSLFTGRWTGGQDSVGDVWNRDPMAVIAPVALATGGAFLGAGALGGAAAEGAVAAEGAAGSEALFGTGATAPELTGAFGEVAAADNPLTAFGAAEGSTGTPSWLTSAQATPATGGGLPSAESAPSWLSGAQATPATGAPADAAGGSWMDSITGYASKHPFQAAGMGAAAGLLGYDLIRGNPKGANVNNEQGLADTTRGMTQEMYATGKQLESYLLNGNLPPGQQAQVTQAVRAAKAAAVSNAAKNGQNTNPTQNTQLAQALSEADMRGLMLASQLETALFNQGTKMVDQALTATGMTQKMYEWLTAQDDKLNQQIQQAIMAFAAASGGGGKGVSLNFGGSKAA